MVMECCVNHMFGQNEQRGIMKFTISSLFLTLMILLGLENPLLAEIRKFDKATIEMLGVSIYEQDIRAASATDMLFAKNIDILKEGLRGWVVEGDVKKRMLVRFVREKDGLLEAFYDVSFVNKKEPVIEIPKNRKLTDSQVAQFKARLLALSHITRPASRKYNIVILPDSGSDGFLVYALAATTEPDKVMVGGHYRFTVSESGDKIVKSDELFLSFMELSTKPEDLAPGAQLSALYMTTMVSDMPLETHVYLSLLHRMTFYVGTPDKHVWKIQNGKMETVR
ncbi:MAG: hypothetical protein WC799_03730 [Desulfobacteraceae bacterium]